MLYKSFPSLHRGAFSQVWDPAELHAVLCRGLWWNTDDSKRETWAQRGLRCETECRRSHARNSYSETGICFLTPQSCRRQSTTVRSFNHSLYQFILSFISTIKRSFCHITNKTGFSFSVCDELPGIFFIIDRESCCKTCFLKNYCQIAAAAQTARKYVF